MNRVGIVIVTWNSADHIAGCLRAASPHADQVVVIDNASTDDTADQVRQTSHLLIQNRSNRGFAAAVNQGAAAMDSDFILLLNPDVILTTGIEPLIEACSEPGVAAASGRLVNRGGAPQRGFTVRRFPTPASLAFEALGLNALWPGNPVNRRYRCAGLDLDAAADVEQPAGAFVMLRRDVWNRLGGMDEQFHPIWFEDVDLLRRIAKLGLRVRYLPTVVARHHGAHSVDKLVFTPKTTYWYDSLLRYASKHFGRLGRSAVCAAVAAGCFPRMPLMAWRERSLRPFVVYCKVIRLAWAHLWRGRALNTVDFAAAGT